MNKHRRFLWFLFGLGTQLQLFGTSLCFTEIFVYSAAVVLISGEWSYMKRNGVMTFFWLSMGVVVNGALSCLYNHSPFFAVIRGMAACCLIPCTIVVAHWMLRKDMSGFRWYLLGIAFSIFLCTFMFRQAVEVSMLADGSQGAGVTQAIMSGPVFWISRIEPIVLWPARAFYLQCPIFYSALAPLGFAAFALLTSASGRSAALGAFAASGIVLIGGRTQKGMRRLGRYSTLLLCMGIAGVFAFKSVYSTAAKSGLLGDKAQMKYENQTRGGESIGRLLLGGRGESFAGLIACVDKPIIGFGPWAIDTDGYMDQFLLKFGEPEDYDRVMQLRAAQGWSGLRLIEAHSHITEFWLWYGIFGLIFWLYVIFALLRYLKSDCYAVPQWYMWLAASAPGMFWAIFFSPYGNRVSTITFVVACLMTRAVRQGRQQLPPNMCCEIMEAAK